MEVEVSSMGISATGSSVVENRRVVAKLVMMRRLTTLDEKAVDVLIVVNAIVMARVAAVAIFRFILCLFDGLLELVSRIGFRIPTTMTKGKDY